MKNHLKAGALLASILLLLVFVGGCSSERQSKDYPDWVAGNLANQGLALKDGEEVYLVDQNEKEGATISKVTGDKREIIYSAKTGSSIYDLQVKDGILYFYETLNNAPGGAVHRLNTNGKEPEVLISDNVGMFCVQGDRIYATPYSPVDSSNAVVFSYDLDGKNIELINLDPDNAPYSLMPLGDDLITENVLQNKLGVIYTKDKSYENYFDGSNRETFVNVVGNDDGIYYCVKQSDGETMSIESRSVNGDTDVLLPSYDLCGMNVSGDTMYYLSPGKDSFDVYKMKIKDKKTEKVGTVPAPDGVSGYSLNAAGDRLYLTPNGTYSEKSPFEGWYVLDMEKDSVSPLKVV